MLKSRDKSVYSSISLSRPGLDQYDPPTIVVPPPPLEYGSRSAASSRLSGISRILKKAFANDSQTTSAVVADTTEVSSSLDLPKDPAEYRDHIIKTLSLDVTSGEAGIVDLTNHVTRGRLVNSGGYGDIYLAAWGYSPPHMNTQLPLLAIKIMRVVRSQDEKENTKRMKLLKREVKVWQELKHTNILPLIGIACLDGDVNFPAIVSPWMENGTVIDYIRKNPSVSIVKFMGEVIDGLNYLHHYRPQIIHGDLKGSNVLVDYRGHIYIGDFGLSRMMEDASLWDTSATQAAGSIRWMAPELLNGRDSRATTASDIYSFAMTCFEMLSGDVPFSRFRMDGAVATAVVVRNERPDRSLVPHVPTTLWKIISDCWDADSARRPRTRTVVKAIKVERESSFPSSITQHALYPVHRPAGPVIGLDGMPLPQYVDLEMIVCFPTTTQVLAIGRDGLFLGDLRDLPYFTLQKLESLPFDGISHLGHPESIAFSPQSPLSQVAIASDSGVHIGILTGALSTGTWRLPRSENVRYFSVAYSPANLVAAGSESGEVSVWDALKLKMIYKFRGEPYSRRASCVAFSHSGELLATASGEFTPIVIRKMQDGSVHCRLHPPRGISYASAIAFSPVAELFVAGYDDGSITFWETVSFQAIHSIFRYSYAVRSLCFSPNGRLICSSSSKGKISIINADSGPNFGSYWTEDLTDVRAVSFASDGKRLVSGSARFGEVQVWDLEW